MSLTESIESAIKGDEKVDETTSVEKPEKADKSPQDDTVDAENEDAEDTDEEESPEAESDLTDDEVKEARDLYKALKNPETSKAVIAALAERTGLNKSETPKEVKAAKKGIQKIIEDALGDDFKFLADKLGPAITEVLNEEKEERNAQFQRIEAQKIEQEVVSVFEQLAKRTNGDSKKLESRMMKIAEEILPGPNTTVKSYVNQLYTLATAGKSDVSNPKKVIDTIKKNANDTSGRLRAAAGGNADNKVDKPVGRMSLDESVKWALERSSGGNKR